MGQAVVDLPDPLEVSPASAASADDLLSQLAGDEIDRLLTEAEVDEPVPALEDEPLATPMVADDAATADRGTASLSAEPATAAKGIAAPPADAATPDLAVALTDTLAIDSSVNAAGTTIAVSAVGASEARNESLAAAAAPVADAPAARATVRSTNGVGDLAASQDAAAAPAVGLSTTTADLDASFNRAAAAPALVTELAGDLAALPQDVARAPVEKLSAADLDSAVAADAEKILAPQTADLRAAGAAENPDAHGVDSHADDATERHDLLAAVAAEPADDETGEAPLPIWLRPLEWVSAPIAAMSDTAREFMGKAALLTLVNSIGVIAYVMFVRKHH